MKTKLQTEFNFKWGSINVYNSFNRITVTMKTQMNVDSLETVLKEVKKFSRAKDYTIQILNLV